MTAVGSKIKYIDGVGLVKMEVLVSEEDVKKKDEEVRRKIEELFRKAEQNECKYIIDETELLISVEGDIVTLYLYNYNHIIAVELDRKEKIAVFDREFSISIEEFEQMLEAFISAKQVLEKVCVTAEERKMFINEFAEKFSIWNPLQAVEKAIREVFGGEGA